MALLNQWIANLVTHRPPRIPLEGVRMAKYHMHYDCTKAHQELALPHTPVETALKKSVEWFRQQKYA